MVFVMNRFFVRPEDVLAGEVVIKSREDIRHITKVLRLKKGAVLEVSDSEKWEYTVRLCSVAEDELRGEIVDRQKFSAEPSLRVTLFQGIPKQGKMETVIQKSVEIGVHGIVPVFTVRTVVSCGENSAKKTERWRKIAGEAVKQCRRGIVPEVGESISFTQMVDLFGDGRFDVVVFPYENEETVSIKDVLRSLGEKPANMAVTIGPEGGFSDDEAETLKNAGTRSVSLGKTILRTETAGLVAIAMIMYELEL